MAYEEDVRSTPLRREIACQSENHARPLLTSLHALVERGQETAQGSRVRFRALYTGGAGAILLAANNLPNELVAGHKVVGNLSTGVVVD